ncbi:MAG: hypothetical protein WDN67_04245 [Candidatus Moraniibacteriota bacterium]
MAGITLVSYWAAGAQNTVYVLLGDFVAFSIIALLAWKYGNGRKFTRLDYFCLIAAFIAIAVYIVSHDPLWVLRAMLVAEVLALVPTMLKSWEHPEEEIS